MPKNNPNHLKNNNLHKFRPTNSKATPSSSIWTDPSIKVPGNFSMESK